MEVSYTSRLTGYGSPSLAAADEETEFVLHALYALFERTAHGGGKAA